jgi:putative exosortase-associated protein (TIGR04073 family)
MELSVNNILKLLMIAAALFFLTAQTAHAQSYQNIMGEKFVSGIANVATGVVELPKNIVLTSQDKGIHYGMTIGVVSGIAHTIGRTVVGLMDVITFMIPTGPSSVQPQYVWNNFSRETTYGTRY